MTLCPVTQRSACNPLPYPMTVLLHTPHSRTRALSRISTCLPGSNHLAISWKTSRSQISGVQPLFHPTPQFTRLHIPPPKVIPLHFFPPYPRILLHPALKSARSSELIRRSPDRPYPRIRCRRAALSRRGRREVFGRYVLVSRHRTARGCREGRGSRVKHWGGREG